jgi:hypothetical protein
MICFGSNKRKNHQSPYTWMAVNEMAMVEFDEEIGMLGVFFEIEEPWP